LISDDGFVRAQFGAPRTFPGFARLAGGILLRRCYYCRAHSGRKRSSDVGSPRLCTRTGAGAFASAMQGNVRGRSFWLVATAARCLVAGGRRADLFAAGYLPPELGGRGTRSGAGVSSRPSHKHRVVSAARRLLAKSKTKKLTGGEEAKSKSEPGLDSCGTSGPATARGRLTMLVTLGGSATGSTRSRRCEGHAPSYRMPSSASCGLRLSRAVASSSALSAVDVVIRRDATEAEGGAITRYGRSAAAGLTPPPGDADASAAER